MRWVPARDGLTSLERTFCFEEGQFRYLQLAKEFGEFLCVKSERCHLNLRILVVVVEAAEDAVVVVVEVGEAAEEEVVMVVVEEEDIREDSKELFRVHHRVVEVIEAAGMSVNLLEEEQLHPLQGHHLSLPSRKRLDSPYLPHHQYNLHRLHKLPADLLSA